MSLPPGFKTPEEYFTEALSFFRQHQHLFNFSNTDILVLNVLDKIDTEDYTEEVFDKDFDLQRKGSSLKEFFEILEKLKVEYDDVIELNDVENNLNGPLGPKKKHEIMHLAKEIKDICERSGCDTVVDFGSGLGYLPQQIFKTTNLKVLGVECNEYNYDCARKRQLKYYMDSIDNVKYVNHTINENSDQNIGDYLKERFDKSIFCVTGLHACADLTIDGITLFHKMADAKALILLPCCYHRMSKEHERFKNFPLSNCLKELFEAENGCEFVNVPFLRLAAQPLIKESDNLQDLVFNLLARATLQLYAHRHNCKLKRNKRKAVRTKTIQNFEEYLQNAANGFSLIKGNETHDDVEIASETTYDFERLNAIWREMENFKLKAAIFILLQNYLQPVFENFVLYDRLLYLRECGIDNCRFKKIFDKKISPRCLALISIK